MRRRSALAPLVAALVLAGSLASTAAPTDVEAAFPGGSERIAFVDLQPGDSAVIWSMTADGDDLLQLTTEAQSPYGDFDPAWSPGGKMLVFTRYTSSGRGEIWRMMADGSGQKRLTTHAADDVLPTFSADGGRIAFSTDRHGSYDIYSMNLDGGGLKRLTSHVADDLYPAWSPDNTRIAFASDRRLSPEDAYFFEIHTMSTTGTSVARETNGSAVEAHDIAPDWHPYEQHLTFTRTYGEDDGDILYVDVVSNSISARTGSNDIEGNSVYGPSQGMIVGDVLWESDAAGDVDIVRATRTSVDPPFLVFDRDGDQFSPDWQPSPVFPLVDWRFSPFANDIEWIYDMELTGGCSLERYCPEDPVTRAQMAIFLDRALPLPETAIDFFTDDDGKTGEASINRLAAAGITGGCTSTRFCPTANVTRGQMAAFLARALRLPPTATDYFTDDETSTFEASINKVAAAGITGGCGGGKYCPLRNVTRGQMAAFLHRAFE
jgi:Tol biopolymer transport system component